MVASFLRLEELPSKAGVRTHSSLFNLHTNNIISLLLVFPLNLDQARCPSGLGAVPSCQIRLLLSPMYLRTATVG